MEMDKRSDKEVRTVRIELPNGRTLVWPVNLISPLEVDDQAGGTEISEDRITVTRRVTTVDTPVSSRTKSHDKKRGGALKVKLTRGGTTNIVLMQLCVRYW